MEDRRVIKTKKNLKATLIEMMGEIPFEQIAITELCKRAEISRITFYSHYSDKYALADDIFSDMLQIGTDIYHMKQKKENPKNNIVMGYCNMLDSILEVYYECFEFFQYTSPQKNPYLAFAFYNIVLETIETHTNKIRKNREVLEVYYECFEFFQYTSPQKNPYLAFAFYNIVLETIETHTNKIRKNREVKYSPKKIAGFLCFGMLGFINEAQGEKTPLDVMTIETHTNKIRKNREVKYSPKKIAGFLCFGMLGFINEAQGEKTPLDVIKKEANQLLKDMLQSGVLVK